jgi:hypothetical protein
VVYSATGLLQATLIVQDTCGVDTAVHQFVIFDKPDFGLHDTAKCDGDSVQVGFTPLAAFAYNWVPAAGVSDPHTSNPWIREANTYIFTATDPWTGCTIIDTLYVGTESGTIDTNSTFVYNTNELTVTFNDTITAPHSVSWNFGDNAGFSAEHNPVYTYSEAGNYKVCATITGCMSFTACQTIQVITGMNYISDKPVLELFPNPAADQLTVLCFIPSSQIEIELFNSLGQQLGIISSQKDRTFTLDLKNFSPGVYYLKVKSSNCPVVKRFVKVD